MKKSVVIVTALLVLALGLTSSSANPGRITVTAVLREQLQPSPGQNAYRYTIFDYADHVIGYQTMSCWAVSRYSNLRQCNATLSLPRGKLIFSGTIKNINNFNLVVTGGDGSYMGAGGSVHESLDGAPNRWSVQVVLS